MATTAIPLILDCDPGHDDVFAIWLAAGNPALELRAITTVAGNGTLVHTTLNARIACTVAGISGVPIAAGADRPLVKPLATAEWIHGENGLGGPELPEPTVPLDPRGAVELMADTLLASAEPVAIVATGPLTNVATLIRDRPELLGRIREIVWMGGTTERGNVTPYAEFNAWVDPDAAAIVLASGIRFTMVGLTVTHQAMVTDAVRDAVAGIGNRTGAFGAELLDFFRSMNQEALGLPDGPLHDPVAVAVLADPETVGSVFTRLDIELAGTETLGVTSVDLVGILEREPNAHVALELDAPRFWRLITDALATLA
ncbi:nucleoside hydrolase [Microterricola viridarii]|uniref:Pyrimidine-specific ribonucleoside hydrolase n=1 Tax=Microterricola viridarii TaxID=412690 RepID=A0A1H1NEM3_9MICO|nr:nucleoside hydrolase [Microterricola viridarii]SDR97421.1 pyrimidine-specific ribonucleoside hydrolase [Microterricola viridarii]